jgi:tetratricopeptide (TPR) repeat protein
MRRFRGPVIIATAALALLGCQGDEAKIAQHMERGDAYLESKDYAEAIIEYKNVLQIDPNQASAHWGLAQSYLQNQQPRQGFWELRETVRLDPSNLEAKLQFAQVSIYAGELEEALKQTDEVVAADPSMVTAYLVRAQALEALKRPEEALEALEKAHELDPDHDAALLMLANFHVQRGDREAAEPLFRHRVDADPSYQTYTALAGFLARDRDRTDEAEEAYKKALELSQGDERVPAYSQLAGLYFRNDRFDDAVALLDEGIAKEEDALDLIYLEARFYQSRGMTEKADALIEQATQEQPDNPRPYLILSAYRGRKGDAEGALAAAEKAVEVDPENQRALLRKAEVLVEIGFRDKLSDKIAEGRAIADKILADEPSHPGALFVKAKIDLAEKRTDDAITSLRAAIDARPDWAQAHFVLGTALVLQGDRTAARTELARALEIDPSLQEAHRVLAQVHAGLGEHEYAVEEGRRFLRERPDATEMRILVAQSLVLLGKTDEALQELEMIPQDERGPETHFAFGRIYMGLGQFDKARQELELAASASPYHPEILRSLLQLDRRENRFPESVARIDAAVAASPDDARLRRLRGVVALMQGDGEAAEASFKKAVELDPTDVSSYEQLARYYAKTGRVQETIETYQKALEVQPDSARIHHFLGVLYEYGGQRQKAIDAYEAAVKNDPNLGEAKNNLAYLFADAGENLDRALDLAQEAKALLPDNPNAADTLGWVLYKRGVPSAAITYLKEAETETEPGSPSLGVVRHHLAQAYKADGQKDMARQTWEKALAELDASRDEARSQGARVDAEPSWASEARSQLQAL